MKDYESFMARSVHLIIKYQKADISKDIRKYVLGLTYTDNATGAADDLQLSLEDREGLWHSSWLPAKGDTIEATFYIENWAGKKEKQLLPCGIFEIDEISLSGPPDAVEIKGQSVPISSQIKQTARTQSWKKIKLSKIANEIANRGGLKCFFDVQEDVEYENLDQVKKPDLIFLQELCNKAGLSLKVTAGQIVIFDEYAYECKDPILTLAKGKSHIISYAFSNKTSDTGYKACHVRYTDAQTNQTIEATFTDQSKKQGSILEVNEQVKSYKEALKLAKSKLREKNKQECTGSLSVLGNVQLVAGITLLLKGFNAFDGKYIVNKATHNIVGGYTTDIEISKCLEGY
nr:hypothetical protein [uncultured Cellulosilyticum sp.]